MALAKNRRYCEDEEKASGDAVDMRLCLLCRLGWEGQFKGQRLDLKQQKQGSVTFLWPPLNNVRRPKLLTSLKPK